MNELQEEAMSLYVVGIGPGSREGMTLAAARVLESCDIIAGYTVYTELLARYYPDKEYYSTPMKQETERCRWALLQAAKGRRICVVCSGDAGIYGMAGLLYQLREGMVEARDVEIHIVPGVTAAVSGAALLGAPLAHDFAVISLSDLLTPARTIWNRIRCAAMGDMVICLYNPSSRKRADYLRKACDIVLEYQSPKTVCGLAKNTGRDGESVEILSLSRLRETQTDMFTTVYIGNSGTMLLSGKMVTPRGYRNV